MKNIISKSVLALLFTGVSSIALADTTYVTCYYDNGKKWHWGLDKAGSYQKISGNWNKTQNTNVYQFHVIQDWSKKDLENVCRRTLEQKGITSQVTGIYAADSSVSSNYEIVYKKQPEAKPIETTKKLEKLGGEWRSINRCLGEKCGNVQVSYTVGVESGKEILKSSSVGKAISSTLGLSAGVYGVDVSTEFTYESNSEQTESIMNSFTQNNSKTIQTTCNGPSEFWQWVSIATLKNGTKTENIEANSDLVACASIGKGPQGKDRRNSMWSPT